MLNQQMIENVLQIAKEIASPQTVADLNRIAASVGKIYDEATLAAEIAVKLMLRLARVDVQSRAVSPADQCVRTAEVRYFNRYGAPTDGL